RTTPISTRFPYTTLFRSLHPCHGDDEVERGETDQKRAFGKRATALDMNHRCKADDEQELPRQRVEEPDAVVRIVEGTNPVDACKIGRAHVWNSSHVKSSY